MHDRKLDEPDQPHRAPGDEISLARMDQILEGLRHQAEPEIEIAGQRFYVFRPFKGRNGFYDRQVIDERD